MKDVLCIYYSRTGNTAKTMEEIATALDAELVRLQDDVKRDGFWGWLRCGLDAMRRGTAPVLPFETERSLANYDLVIVGTPVWAGRCSAVTRSFLKRNGRRLNNVAYVATRGSEVRSDEVFEQMDLYVPNGHKAAATLRPDTVGYEFWREEFLRQVREILG